MASSSHVSNLNTETATSIRNDQPISTRSKDKGVFTQKSHLKEILEKVRDLSASCTLYQETWTDDQENKALMRLIGKILSVIPTEEGQNESQPVQAEDRPPQVVRQNIKREEEGTFVRQNIKREQEGTFLPVPDVHHIWLYPDVDTIEPHFTVPWHLPYGGTELLPLPVHVTNRAFNGLEIDYAEDGVFTTRVASATGLGTHTRWHYPEPGTVQVSNSAGRTSQTPGANEIHPSTRKRSRNHGHREAESSQPSPKKRRASDALSDSVTTPFSHNSD